jgi:hypothetical protein
VRRAGAVRRGRASAPPVIFGFVASYEANEAVRKQIIGEKASALALAMETLEAALAELAGAPIQERAEAFAEAAERLWFVVVQREAMGLVRHEHVYETLRVPREVRLGMGPRRSRSFTTRSP